MPPTSPTLHSVVYSLRHFELRIGSRRWTEMEEAGPPRFDPCGGHTDLEVQASFAFHRRDGGRLAAERRQVLRRWRGRRAEMELEMDMARVRRVGSVRLTSLTGASSH